MTGQHASTVAAPLVTLLLPTFNEPAAFVDVCVAALTAQTLSDFECLVLDDSTDPAARAAWDDAAVREPRIQVLRSSTRLGLTASLNRGVERSRGAFIARIDADDICTPERLERQHAWLSAHPEIDLVGSRVKIIEADGTPAGHRKYPLEHKDIAAKLSLQNAIAHPTVFARRAAFERFGTYDASYRYCEDLELWLRWLRKGARFHNLEDALVTLRLDAGTRPQRHWRYNLKARISNFYPRHALGQALGIVLVAGASIMPASVPRAIWRSIMVRGGMPSLSKAQAAANGTS